MNSEIARAEVERLVTALAERDRTLVGLRAELDQVRLALKAESRQTLELVRATLPVVRSRTGITPHALAKLDATVTEVLRAGAERHRADPELAAELGKLVLYLGSER